MCVSTTPIQQCQRSNHLGVETENHGIAINTASFVSVGRRENVEVGIFVSDYDFYPFTAGGTV